ncbi:bifunctional riboflavin kinase/FAD synthetase [candidate division WOR-3 bacterium]|nr:bifunctional riboflavin kinase/FAD synthetase [candidate division WOR-3 bacterium]
MKIVWGLEKKGFRRWKTIITIGSFDGIHMGHKAILNSIIKLSSKYEGKSVVVSFDPLPKEFLQGETFKAITTIEEKMEILQGFGIDGVCIIPFTEEFSNVEAYDFLESLWEHLHPYAIAFGHNHHFGNEGKGGVSLLKEFSSEKGIDLLEVKEVKIRGKTVSSSRIRNYITQGDIKKANEMLGREFVFIAKVNRGSGIGRTLSYPTANLKLNSYKKILPKEGVYAVRVLIGSNDYGAMLYVGTRPTFSEDSQSTCEVYVMGFEGDLYGKKLVVKVLDRIREERKFCSPQSLKAQIINDEETAIKIIASSVVKQGGYGVFGQKSKE